MTYEEWNAGLAAHFFNAAHAGRRVYLHTTPELLLQLGGSEADFVRAVKAGPRETFGSMCGKAVVANYRWSDRRTPPPFLAHLCLFALAATRDGDWASYAYYPRLWDLIGEAGAGAPPEFGSMKGLWRELQLWTQADMAGALGFFKAQAAGKWIHVGLPIAQAILTEAERRQLPAIFEEADLEPGANLAPEEIAAAVAAHNGHRLRARTADLLLASGTSEFRAELLLLLQAELAEWNGAPPPAAAPGKDARRAGMRIWLKRVDPAGFVSARLAARIPGDMDAADLSLSSRRFPGIEFACAQGPAGLTEAVYSVETGQELAAGDLPWAERTEFQCRTTGARFVLPPTGMRVFASGADDGMGGYIETRVLPPSGGFLIATSPTESAAIARWGSEFCSNWRERTVRGGLPPGWRLFEGADARGDGGLASRFPALSRPVFPRIRFEGGVHFGAGARYFPFALPMVRIDWPERPQSVSCNGTPLAARLDGRYEIPVSAAAPICQIDARFADREAHDVLFTVSDGWQWGDGSACAPSNQFGLIPSPGEPQFRGADMGGAPAPEFQADPATAVQDSGNAVWIGRVPGQVADLRRGDPPPHWAPVWLVTFRRQLVQFTYCGISLDSSGPERTGGAGPVKKWKAVLWTTRKRTAALRNPQISALLRRYREAANAL